VYVKPDPTGNFKIKFNKKITNLNNLKEKCIEQKHVLIRAIISNIYIYIKGKGKVKISLFQAVEAHRVERLRLPHYLDKRLIDGGKVVSPTRLPHFTPRFLYF
jgi:hypothetical protein